MSDVLSDAGFSGSVARPGKFASVLNAASASLSDALIAMLNGSTWNEIAGRWIGGNGLRRTPPGSGAIIELAARWEGRARVADTDDADVVNRLIKSAEEIIAGADGVLGVSREVSLTRAVAEVAEATVEEIKTAVKATTPWILILAVVYLAVSYGPRRS